MKSNFLLKKALLFIICFNLISCGNDNDENITDQDLPSANLDKESETIINKYKSTRQWIGRWNTSSRKPDFIFLSDGTCLMDGKYTTGYTVGKWKYNPNTKYMTTTCGSWIWTVNDFDISQWTGISSGGTAYVYTRGYWNCPNDELLIGKWINTEASISITFKANKEYIITATDTEFKGIYEVNTYSPSDWNDEYLFARYMYLSGDINGKMRVNYLDGKQLIFDDFEGSSETKPYKLTYIYSDFVK